MATGFPSKDSLDRFLDAQNAKREGYAVALSEIKAGRKSSHWMWYIFPQLRGLGRSVFADYYGIADIDEARSYLAHKILGHRLREITAALLDIEGKSAEEIFGPVDAMKLRSCMTLFDAVEPDGIFRKVRETYFERQSDPLTLSLI